MKNNYWILLIALLAVGFLSCSDSDDDGYDLEEIYRQEEERIEEYLKTLNTTTTKLEYTNSKGVTSIVYVYNNVVIENYKYPEENDFILYSYENTNLNKDVVYDLTNPSKITGNKYEDIVEFRYGGPVYYEMKDNYIYSDILELVAEHTTAQAIIPSRLHQEYPGRTYHIDFKVEKIIGKEKDLLPYEMYLIETYKEKIEKNIVEDWIEIKLGETDTTGFYARTFINEDGEAIEPTDSVKIEYSFYVINEFNENFRRKIYPRESGDTGISKFVVDKEKVYFFNEFITNLKNGEKAYALFPSGMGFGKKGSYDGYQYLVPPYSTLFYEVEVLEVKKNK